MTGYDTPGPIRAVLDLSAARLWINAGARADTQVRIDPANPDSPEDVKAAQRIQADYTEGELTVRGAQGTWGSWLSSGGLAEVVLDLPAGSSLEVRTSAGDIRAYGRLGDVTAHTSHGEIALTRTGNARLSTESGGIRLGVARGAVELRAPDGDIHVEEVTGELNAGTAGGSITVGRAHAGVTAKTKHGDIRLREVATGTVLAETGAGEVEIGLRPGAAAELQLTTRSGTVRDHLGEPDTTPAESTVLVRATTTHGDILLRRA